MKLRFGLLPRIIVAIVLGMAIGACVPSCVVRGVNTFAALFDQFIKFMVPLIILGLVAPAIAETGRGAGRMLLMTFAIAYLSTLPAMRLLIHGTISQVRTVGDKDIPSPAYSRQLLVGLLSLRLVPTATMSAAD